MAYFSALIVLCLVTASSSFTVKDDSNLTPGAKEVFNRLGVGRGELSMQVSEGARKMGESPIYYIKLPPSSYYYSPKKTSNKPLKKVPISFHNNGKPQKVYHWTQPVSSKRPIYIKPSSPYKQSQTIHIKTARLKQQPAYVKPFKLTSPQKQFYPEINPTRIKTSTIMQQPIYVKPAIPFRQSQSVDETYSVAMLPKPSKLISAQSQQQTTYVKPHEPLTLLQSQTKDENKENNSANTPLITEPKITIKSQEGNLNKPINVHSELESGTEAHQPMIIKSSPTFSNIKASLQQSQPAVEKPKLLIIKPTLSFINPQPIPIKAITSEIGKTPTSLQHLKVSTTETPQGSILRFGKTPNRKPSIQSTDNLRRKNSRYLAKDFTFNGRPDIVYIWRPDKVHYIKKSTEYSE